MSTVKLYDNLPYETEFTAKIIKISSIVRENNLYELVLDQTLFFPEAGGQSCDKGSIKTGDSTTTVERVIIDNEDVITHIIRSELPLQPDSLIGIEIAGMIDWTHRFSNMQQHSAEHIFSGIVHRKYGFENVGFHLSDNNVTMDYSGYLTPEQVAEIEFETNRVIAQNISITCYYPNENELKDIDYRCKSELSGDIRIVEIKGVDICACCCPHVKQTGEIGLMKVISSVRYKGGTRLSILCGLLYAEKGEIVNTVTLLKNERDELKNKLREVNRNLLISEIDNLPDGSPSLIFADEINPKSQREALNYLISKRDNYCGILSGNDKKGYSYLIGSNNLDSVLVQTKLKEGLNAKGGGKKEMIQGFAEASRKELEALLNTFPFN